MNWTKNLFIISLLNFIMIAGVIVFYPSNREVEEADELGGEEVEQSVAIPTITLKSSQTPTQTNAKNTASVKNTTTPTKNSTPTPTAPQDPLAGKCIIYVSGIRYNITEFRNTHGGGDIFQCGTDMTDNFKSQHPDSYLDQMSRYKI